MNVGGGLGKRTREKKSTTRGQPLTTAVAAKKRNEMSHRSPVGSEGHQRGGGGGYELRGGRNFLRLAKKRFAYFPRERPNN